jgi:hypothetical protein
MELGRTRYTWTTEGSQLLVRRSAYVVFAIVTVTAHWTVDNADRTYIRIFVPDSLPRLQNTRAHYFRVIAGCHVVRIRRACIGCSRHSAERKEHRLVFSDYSFHQHDLLLDVVQLSS